MKMLLRKFIEERDGQDLIWVHASGGGTRSGFNGWNDLHQEHDQQRIHDHRKHHHRWEL